MPISYSVIYYVIGHVIDHGVKFNSKHTISCTTLHLDGVPAIAYHKFRSTARILYAWRGEEGEGEGINVSRGVHERFLAGELAL